MKSFIALVSLIALAGCANTATVPTHSTADVERQHVADLKQDTSKMIDDLAAGAGDVARHSASTLWNADYSGMSREAWDWTLAHMETVWNLEMSKEARARLRKCWFDVKNNPTVENKANFDKCWADLRQSSK
jgi:outer membrane murein-binding lipoprotein Lpp